VSSERQPERRAGRERQALAAACRRRGWTVLESVSEVGLAAQERNAPGLEQALRLLESGEANTLVAAKLERLPQALGELAALLARAPKRTLPS
jgi:DNA invertase Pin-like site-specific DNA recombinase